MRSPDFPYLTQDQWFQFPAVESATDEGIVGVGGNLSPGMLLSAYHQGIFPWYSGHEPIIWWSPDPRFVLFPNELHISKSMRRFLRTTKLTVTFDDSFIQVMEACRDIPRTGQRGTWITDEILSGYSKLHELGVAHSVEVHERDDLVGGLYGVSLGRTFFGESMFASVANASKLALVWLCRLLAGWNFDVIDCQVYTPHLDSLGARMIPRRQFLDILESSTRKPTPEGQWSLPDTAGAPTEGGTRAGDPAESGG